MTPFTETVDRHHGQLFTVDRTVHRERSDHQDIFIFDNALFGRVLVLDGLVQTTERDEHIYHEMIAHVPLVAHGGAARVLVVGGGDGGTLREVLKHPVERAVMVEIDRRVVTLSREHLPGLSNGAFDNTRAALVIDDAAVYLRRCDETFDAIIVDSTDPVGPGEALFADGFYELCQARLAPGGVLVTQAGVPFTNPEPFLAAHARLAARFADTAAYQAAVPTYTGGPMTFGWASDAPALRATPPDVLADRFAALGLATRHYTPAVHTAAFALPRALAEALAEVSA